MANIRERNGSYQITVSLGRDMAGKQIRESLTYKPRATSPKAIEKEVAAAAVTFEREVREGRYLSGEKLTFERFVEEYWKPQWSVENLTLSCQEDYYDKIKRHAYPAFKTMKIARIMPLHIQNIIADMKSRGLAPRTIKRAIVPINSVFSYAYRLRLIQENPCERCELPKIKQDTAIHYFTVDQAKRFLKFLSEPYTTTHKAHERIDDTGKAYSVPEYTEKHITQYQFRVFFNLAIYGGFRRGELIGLQWHDIDFEKNKISIVRAAAKVSGGQIIKEPKTAKGKRVVTMPAESMDLLREWNIRQKELCMKLGTQWQGERGDNYNRNFVFIQIDSGKEMYLDTPSSKFRKTITRYNQMIDEDIKKKKATEDDKLPMIKLHDLRHSSATLLISQGMDVETLAARLGHAHPSTTLDIYGHALPENDEIAASIIERLFAVSE